MIFNYLWFIKTYNHENESHPYFSIFLISYFSVAQWSADPLENNGIALASGEEAIPKVATSIYGTTYISWFSSVGGSYNVRLQKLDVFGNMLWDSTGLLVSDHPSDSWLTDWDMAVDYEDCAILTFQDIRNGDNDVFAYRISPNGEFLWGDDGIEMSTGPAFDAAPKCCVTNAGNVVFAWQADVVVILQKISPEGNKLWGDNGITLSGANSFSWPQLLPVEADDVMLKYFEDSGPVWAPTRHVFAQRYDSDGNTVWTSPAIVSNAGGISAWTQLFSFISDGNDGFYMAWHDDRDFDNQSSTFVQHIGSDGAVLLGDDGTEASTMFNHHHFYPHLSLPAGSADVFVFWNEMDLDQNNRGIYGQKLSSTGERLWGDNGKVFIEISPTNVYPFAASQTDENMILFYETYSTVLNASVCTMMLDTDGDFVWAGQKVEFCAFQSEKVHTVAGNFHDGQWISAWEDSRNGGRDIYAQNIQADGSLGPIVIPQELTITPDSVVCDTFDTYYVYIMNETADQVMIEDAFFDFGLAFFTIPPALPAYLNVNDTLVIELSPSPGSAIYNPEGYVIEFLNILTSIGDYEVDIYVNEDLLGSVQKNDSETPIFLYPNPARNTVSFDVINLGLSGGEINILNTSGDVVKKIQINGHENIVWDLKKDTGQRLKQGSYYFQVISDKTILSGKLLIL
ncbi:MAG: T9SS type A sorting domain-containing protein [Bacteroidales bacterium]